MDIQRTERNPHGEHSSSQEEAEASGGRRSGGAGGGAGGLRHQRRQRDDQLRQRERRRGRGDRQRRQVQGAADLHRAGRPHRPVDVARQEHVPDPAGPEPVQPEHPGDDGGDCQEGRHELHHLPQPGHALGVGAGHERRPHREARHHRAEHRAGSAHPAAAARAGQGRGHPGAGDPLLRRLLAGPARLRGLRGGRHRAGHRAVQRGGQRRRRLDHRRLEGQRERAAHRGCRRAAQPGHPRHHQQGVRRAVLGVQGHGEEHPGVGLEHQGAERGAVGAHRGPVDQLRLPALRRDGRGRGARRADARQDRPGQGGQLQRLAVRAEVHPGRRHRGHGRR